MHRIPFYVAICGDQRERTTVVPAKSDSDVMFYLQSY